MVTTEFKKFDWAYPFVLEYADCLKEFYQPVGADEYYDSLRDVIEC